MLWFSIEFSDYGATIVSISFQISKVVNTCLILLGFLVCHTVEVQKYHTNCRLNFESFICYCRYRVDKGPYTLAFSQLLSS